MRQGRLGRRRTDVRILPSLERRDAREPNLIDKSRDALMGITEELSTVVDHMPGAKPLRKNAAANARPRLQNGDRRPARFEAPSGGETRKPCANHNNIYSRHPGPKVWGLPKRVRHSHLPVN